MALNSRKTKLSFGTIMSGISRGEEKGKRCSSNPDEARSLFLDESINGQTD
ncbi:unnamed protein product [Dovyalis caffra]|uniref:Uncharacterized protein n=1 Tax=Dovyalis caffra TaxID=77055 RepID=A0AAV1S662_9ROSI|nr:unnamed protein product [Dovyalis caffra]